MKLDHSYYFNQSFQTLPKLLFEEVRPTPLKNAKLVHYTQLKNNLGLRHLSELDLLAWLNGELELEGAQRIATRYAGHQFGVWAGQLGDGRAISLGEILTPHKKRFEIQTKGSGLTPFSRMGDGKAVIRSSVREYVCAEAMHGLGIPTTRSLALIIGEDSVYREQVERSALVARVFESNLRFGHFEYCFHFNHADVLADLIQYTRETFFQNMALEEMLREIVRRTAILMAHWQSVGFCHGVMNTDNMSVLGLTIDYGPFGFLEDTQLNYICNHSDHQGRYAYNQQPAVALWNLERFLICFLEKLPKEKLELTYRSYIDEFENAYHQKMRSKLGLVETRAGDSELCSELLKALSFLNIDFTFFFRSLGHYEIGKMNSLQMIWDYYGNREELIQWLKKYDQRLLEESSDNEARKKSMMQINPKYVLKNYIAQEIIDEVEKGRDDKLRTWLNLFAAPFEEHSQFDKYSLPTPSEFKNIEVSCSS
jgi:uncharacterized protein YdiU (UPF0061 family)